VGIGHAEQGPAEFLSAGPVVPAPGTSIVSTWTFVRPDPRSTTANMEMKNASTSSRVTSSHRRGWSNISNAQNRLTLSKCRRCRSSPPQLPAEIDHRGPALGLAHCVGQLLLGELRGPSWVLPLQHLGPLKPAWTLQHLGPLKPPCSTFRLPYFSETTYSGRAGGDSL
jgi:hypothetical protein